MPSSRSARVKGRITNPPDHGLWDEVRRTITPLRQPRALPVAARGGTWLAPPTLPGPRASPSGQQPALLRDVRRAVVPPPLAAFDRRLAQRLSRGQLEPEARIDLHGDGLEMARIKLFHFIEAQRRNGSRLILVITGKGASPFARHTLHGVGLFHAPEREGRLRREVPNWLHEAHFRDHVSGFQPAHPRHGGGGAYYVRLRRIPEHP